MGPFRKGFLVKRTFFKLGMLESAIKCKIVKTQTIADE